MNIVLLGRTKKLDRMSLRKEGMTVSRDIVLRLLCSSCPVTMKFEASKAVCIPVLNTCGLVIVGEKICRYILSQDLAIACGNHRVAAKSRQCLHQRCAAVKRYLVLS